MTTLHSLVIEHLVDSDFDPCQHEAYAFCCEGIPTHRIGGFLLRELDYLDWDSIELAVERSQFWQKLVPWGNDEEENNQNN